MFSISASGTFNSSMLTARRCFVCAFIAKFVNWSWILYLTRLFHHYIVSIVSTVCLACYNCLFLYRTKSFKVYIFNLNVFSTFLSLLCFLRVFMIMKARFCIWWAFGTFAYIESYIRGWSYKFSFSLTFISVVVHRPTQLFYCSIIMG